MVVSDHNRPTRCNAKRYLGYKIKTFDVRTTEMKKFLYGKYKGFMCYWLNDGIIRHWVAPP